MFVYNVQIARSLFCWNALSFADKNINRNLTSLIMIWIFLIAKNGDFLGVYTLAIRILWLLAQPRIFSAPVVWILRKLLVKENEFYALLN